MNFISIGPFCATAQNIKDCGQRKFAYPFDWAFSSLEIVKHCLDDRFEIFLDKSYYTKGFHENATQHTYYHKLMDTEVLNKRLRHTNNKPALEADFLHHDNLIRDNERYECYIRRCNRLLELIDNGENICLVYYNMYCNDTEELIAFSKHFEKYKNILVLGLYQNNKTKEILYESNNCKIYQNYNSKEVFDKYKIIPSLNLVNDLLI